ncbi:MAG TPA: zinc-binding dehydrogenase [Spirochaetia bacterium]|nr:zinc-binding dehydrogenase [Spirochaetia bacterium]
MPGETSVRSQERVRAAVMTGPGGLEVRDFPFPRVLDDGALVRVELSGICGTDKHAYKGEGTVYGGTKAETGYRFPVIPGHETVGTIEALGRRAQESINTPFGYTPKVGDRVIIGPDIFCGSCYYCRTYGQNFIWCDNMRAYGQNPSCSEAPHLFGGWAEYVYILPNSYLFKVPDNLPPRTAVFTELMAVTYNLDKAREFYSMSNEGFKTGDTVVIQGVGPLGLCHVIKARMLGAGDIVVVDSSPFRLELAREFGADVCLNIEETTMEDRVERVRELTHGVGADLVVECTGSAKAILEGIETTRKGGMYIVTGMFVDTGETVAINPHRHLCAKNIRLIGMTDEPPSGYDPMLKLMDKFSRYMPFDKFVTHEFALDQVGAAMDASMDANSSMKVVINPQK